MFSNRVDEWLKHELKMINMSLPAHTIPLSVLLRLEEPCVKTLGGGVHHFDRRELEEFKRSLPEGFDVSLPLIFIRRGELGEGVYVIKGEKKEAEAFRLALGLSSIHKSAEGYYTYKPFVIEFLRRYKTLGVVGTY
ncbi:MAG: hypothetical protein B9J98_03825 [Candidatus Terraquivivens tikiterensis]|uniref:DUF61 family protein n=1 Tax=Candidatus Terraquivivens tikiterensis TaxID=1980982 RepID=A0A2R7Y768_9ARCH|nr:MAG: hypothetical protein B9J98_03825 [Candidatus Terraquivivens tikiterensis]